VPVHCYSVSLRQLVRSRQRGRQQHLASGTPTDQSCVRGCRRTSRLNTAAEARNHRAWMLTARCPLKPLLAAEHQGPPGQMECRPVGRSQEDKAAIQKAGRQPQPMWPRSADGMDHVPFKSSRSYSTVPMPSCRVLEAKAHNRLRPCPSRRNHAASKVDASGWPTGGRVMPSGINFRPMTGGCCAMWWRRPIRHGERRRNASQDARPVKGKNPDISSLAPKGSARIACGGLPGSSLMYWRVTPPPRRAEGRRAGETLI
jgi:hypothetical protein